LQVDEVLFEGLAVALETLPPFKRRFAGPGFGRLAAAGKLGAGFAALVAEPGGLGRPVLGLWGNLWGAVTFGGVCQFSRAIFRSRSKFARPYMSRLRYLILQFLPSRAPLLQGRASPAVTACWSRRMPRAKE